MDRTSELCQTDTFRSDKYTTETTRIVKSSQCQYIDSRYRKIKAHDKIQYYVLTNQCAQMHIQIAICRNITFRMCFSNIRIM